MCRQLVARGARLVVTAQNAERLQTLADELGAHPYPGDATQSAQVDACVARALERHGRLDGVARCVGSLLLKPAHLTSDAEWGAALAVNLTSAFAVVRASARVMKDSGGLIILVSSAAARAGLANHKAIAAANLGTGVLQSCRKWRVQRPRPPSWRSKCPAQPGGIQVQWIMS